MPSYSGRASRGLRRCEGFVSHSDQTLVVVVRLQGRWNSRQPALGYAVLSFVVVLYS